MLARETAVVRGDVLFADAFTEMSCDSLCESTCVNKDESCVVLAD